MLKLTVESGAGEPVIPGDEAANVPLEDGDMKGCKYEVANGHIIRNKGQKDVQWPPETEARRRS